jgi:protein-L-isoaspartate(D-aspartate) O-methyltransferase
MQHAACTEQLAAHLRPGAHVLDVGSGSGYLTAILAHMVSPGGRVTGVEVVPPLVERSRAALAADEGVRAAVAAGTHVSVHEADAHWGWPQDAPYDAIHVGAGA